MKRTFNKGGRPNAAAAERRKYVVSTRLDSRQFFHLKALARKSGQQTAEIIRQLIAQG